MKLPSPAMVVAVIALIVALGGVAGAATTMITTKMIADNAVTRGKIANSAVDSAKIANGSIQASDLSVGARSMPGPQGPAGTAGAKGETGATGARGPAGAQTVVDGNGSTLGDLIAVTDTTPTGSHYIVRIGARLWKVDSNGKFLSSSGLLVWTNSSCSGTPLYEYGESPLMRNSGSMYTQIVYVYADGSAVAYDVPNDITSVVTPANTVRYTKWGNKSCISAGAPLSYDLYGSNSLTPVSLPTLVPPLTIG